MKDFVILCIAVLLSVVLFTWFGCLIPAVLAMIYAFLTIKKDDITVLDFIKHAVRYFMSNQQYYEWR